MASVAWEISHSVETDACPAFAWSYWTDIANWDDPPAEFELDGPFAAGACGATRLPGQEPLQWFIREVHAPDAATIEIRLDGAALCFEWRFAELPDGRTRLTQRIALQGENAERYVSEVKVALTENMVGGMNRLAAAMADADWGRKR